MAIAPDGALWIATFNGVSRFDGTNWTNYTQADGLAHYLVPSIAIENDGTVWFGTAGGVSHFDGSDWTTYTKDDGLVSDAIVSMAIDSAGVKWFGAIEGGVSSFDGTNWKTFTAADGLAYNGEIRSIAVDQENAKWFGSKWAGISKYVEGPTSVAENTKVPAVMCIRGNSPNPFNSSTIIEFNLDREAFVKLDIFNISGQKIKYWSTRFFRERAKSFGSFRHPHRRANPGAQPRRNLPMRYSRGLSRCPSPGPTPLS